MMLAGMIYLPHH